MQMTRANRRRRRRSLDTGHTPQPSILTQLRQPHTSLRKSFVFFRSSGRTEIHWTIEPSGKPVDPQRARAAVESGRLVATDLGLPLFDSDQSHAQSWIFRSPAEEESALASLLKRNDGNAAEEADMDAMKYLKPKFLKIVELKAMGAPEGTVMGPLQDGEKYDRPNLPIEIDGVPYLLGLNDPNLMALVKAWGRNSTQWVGHAFRLEACERPGANGNLVEVLHHNAVRHHPDIGARDAGAVSIEADRRDSLRARVEVIGDVHTAH